MWTRVCGGELSLVSDLYAVEAVPDLSYLLSFGSDDLFVKTLVNDHIFGSLVLLRGEKGEERERERERERVNEQLQSSLKSSTME